MEYYKIYEGNQEERKEISKLFDHLDLLPKNTQQRVITAWITTIHNSHFELLQNVPAFKNSNYPLHSHINDVVSVGNVLADNIERRKGTTIDREKLNEVLFLHDIDKPMLRKKQNNKLIDTNITNKIQHGLLGALVLRDLGFSDDVVNIVANHSPSSHFHPQMIEAYILYYADLFSVDDVLLSEGLQPYYTKFSLS